MIDADKTLRDFTDVLNGWADHRPLQKAGASAHAKAKAQHHGELAGLYETIAEGERNIAHHYRTGAAGAHEAADDDAAHDEGEGDDGRDDADPHRFHEDEGDELELRVLKAKAADGDITARIRLDALAKVAMRAALRRPHMAADGVIVGRRGYPMADL